MENHMAASSYHEVLARLLVHEGGNDDDPRDPGGRTSRGILQREWDVWRRSHPGLPADVWRAPQDQVAAIYRQNYWNALRCDDLPAGVDYAVFDYGVNSGIGRAAKVLQRLVATAMDGEVGPETIAAAKRAKAAALIEAICDERLAFLQGLRTWATFGRGWGRRVREVRAAALKMAKSAKSAGDKSAGDKSAGDKSAGDKSAGDKPPRAAQSNPAASAKDREPPARSARRLGIGAGVVAAIGAAAHWAGSHPILTAGAVVIAALVVLVVSPPL